MECILELTAQNFEQEALCSPVPVFIEICSPHYSSCSDMSDIVNSLAKDFHKQMRFGRIDIDKQPILASKLSIGGLPSIVIMQDGRICNHTGGILPLPYYERLLNVLLSKRLKK